MKLLWITLLLAGLAACTTQFESMKRADGSSYTYLLNKVGGQAAAESSSGTKLVVNDEGSFATFMQTMGVAFAGWTAASIQKAKEISAQVASREITQQQAQQQVHALQMAELGAKAGATSEAIGAGAEVAPVVITPP
jgi:hypothetical protein